MHPYPWHMHHCNIYMLLHYTLTLQSEVEMQKRLLTIDTTIVGTTNVGTTIVDTTNVGAVQPTVDIPDGGE